MCLRRAELRRARRSKESCAGMREPLEDRSASTRIIQSFLAHQARLNPASYITKGRPLHCCTHRSNIYLLSPCCLRHHGREATDRYCRSSLGIQYLVSQGLAPLRYHQQTAVYIIIIIFITITGKEPTVGGKGGRVLRCRRRRYFLQIDEGVLTSCE